MFLIKAHHRHFHGLDLQDYPGEELLLVYDYDFKFGENFYVCLTEEAKDWVLNVSQNLHACICL